MNFPLAEDKLSSGVHHFNFTRGGATQRHMQLKGSTQQCNLLRRLFVIRGPAQDLWRMNTEAHSLALVSNLAQLFSSVSYPSIPQVGAWRLKLTLVCVCYFT